MNRIFVLLFCACLCVYSHAQEFNAVYVSSSKGNDANIGSVQSPLRTIRAAKSKSKKYMKICLKRGDVFFESLTDLENCIIEPYGKGEKPILCGFKVLKFNEAWKQLDKHIWCVDLRKDANFCGYARENATNAICFDNIGMVYNLDENIIYGNLLKDRNKLNKTGDYYTSDIPQSKDLKEDTFGNLYMYFDEAPTQYGQWCFSVYEHGISNLWNCKVRDIAVVGFACHGVCRIWNTTIENCDIDLIGGSILIGYNGWVRYGNGVELNVSANSCNHCVIKNCQITRCYDTATTIQGSGFNLADPTDIHFVKNRIAYCRQAFEWYAPAKGTIPHYVDCEFSENICYMSGNNMFGIDKQASDCNLLCVESREEPLKVEGNLMYGGSYFFSTYIDKAMKNNTVYLYPKQFLFFNYRKDNHIYANHDMALEKYMEQSGDNSRFYIIEEGSKEDVRLSKKIKKKLNLRFPKLNI